MPGGSVVAISQHRVQDVLSLNAHWVATVETPDGELIATLRPERSEGFHRISIGFRRISYDFMGFHRVSMHVRWVSVCVEARQPLERLDLLQLSEMVGGELSPGAPAQ